MQNQCTLYYSIIICINYVCIHNVLHNTSVICIYRKLNNTANINAEIHTLYTINNNTLNDILNDILMIQYNIIIEYTK